MGKDKRRRRHGAKRSLPWNWILAGAAIVTFGLVLRLTHWFGLMGTTAQVPQPTLAEGVVELNSLVGKTAPSFTLTDSTGNLRSFSPGDGRKHMFVFHMGYF